MLPAAVLKGKYFYLGELLQKRQLVIGIVIVILSLLVRFNEYYTFRELTSDKSRQLHGAYQLVNGEGLQFKSYDLETFQPQFKPVIDWPPAYSYIIAGIGYFGLNLYEASVLLDLFCLVALWFTMFWFTRLLNFNLFQQLLLFLLLAFAKTLFLKLYSSDLLATTIFLFSAALLVSVIQNKGDKPIPGWFYLVEFSGIFLMVFLKYSILPACFALGLSVLSYAIFSNRKFGKVGVTLLVSGAVFLGTLMLYNFMAGGETTTMAGRHPEKADKFYFENLILFDPFIANAFIFLDILYSRFSYYPVHYSALALTVVATVWILIKNIIKIKRKEADFFSHLLVVTIICVICFLSALSIHYPRDAYGSYVWTYVTEFRYFAPAVFLVILFLVKYVRLKLPVKNFSFVISAFVVTCISVTFVLGIYYRVTDNNAGSFESLYGKIFRVKDFVEKQQGDETYFLSLSNHPPTDSETTSLVALGGTKVAMTYYGYFPAAAYSGIFSESSLVPAGKKIIVFIDHNDKVLNTINLSNRHTIEQNSHGEKFLIINN